MTTPSAAARVRHPLGLPAGSVRALLTLLVLIPIWVLMLLPKEKGQVPIGLYCLMFLVLGSFFAAHGQTIGHPTGGGSPLHLPRGSLRGLIILGFVAVLGWQFYITRDFSSLLQVRQPSLDADQPY